MNDDELLEQLRDALDRPVPTAPAERVASLRAAAVRAQAAQAAAGAAGRARGADPAVANGDGNVQSPHVDPLGRRGRNRRCCQWCGRHERAP